MSTNYVPALKAKMGDWTYYITKMKFGEVAKQVELAEEIHPNKELDQLIQRELSGRVTDMTEFLLNEKQRFYGSLVVAIYNGNPQFHPIRIDEQHGIVDKVNHSFGLLQMDGSQTYFALDGQHRLESIKNAVKENVDLKNEEISVLIIKHDETKDGMVRTRRLFTKLNRYAKPTDQKTNIAIDEDDCVAITTRRMVRELDAIKKLIKIDSTGKQISTSTKDSIYFSTLASLYECNYTIGQSYNNGTDLDKDFLSKRPDDAFLDDFYLYLSSIWEQLFSKIKQLEEISSQKSKPGKYRTKDGGSIWMRPIGQLIYAETIQRSLLEDKEISEITDNLNKIPTDLTKEPWVNIIWNPDTKRISGAKAERAFITELLCKSTGLAKTKINKKDLESKYAEYHKTKSKKLPIFK
ncbi:DNA sulfur modification protein DndB [Endozoicomonas sp. ALE010]|uniref:DNA sulfur modification protein DndB n=1 Tax=Endozoicomonas sp. ALE010 TaxID=3403081 RepID=UPI003BB4F528